MKSAEIFNDFNWNDLVDFKMKAPYIPEAWDSGNHLKNVNNPYEAVIEVNLF
jgi:hypothetical protein